MKAILLSVQPKWLEKILNGEKTIEIRKSKPNCELPIDIYVYCSKGGCYLYDKWDNCGTFIDYSLEKKNYNKPRKLNGKVVAKFTLNKVEDICISSDDLSKHPVIEFDKFKDILKKSCLSNDECQDYIRGKGDEWLLKPFDIGYAWHIDNLVVFDKPKELKEFYKVGNNKWLEEARKQHEEVRKRFGNEYRVNSDEEMEKIYKLPIINPNVITKSPQSFMYVEVEE